MEINESRIRKSTGKAVEIGKIEESQIGLERRRGGGFW